MGYLFLFVLGIYKLNLLEFFLKAQIDFKPLHVLDDS